MPNPDDSYLFRLVNNYALLVPRFFPRNRAKFLIHVSDSNSENINFNIKCISIFFENGEFSRVYKGISFNTEKDIARLKKIKEQS